MMTSPAERTSVSSGVNRPSYGNVLTAQTSALPSPASGFPPAGRGASEPPAPAPTRRAARAAVAAANPGMTLLASVWLSLSGALLVLVLALATIIVALPALTGSTPLTVLTQSMEPGLPPGTLVVVKPTDVNDMRIGQVLTYQIESGQPALVSHRIISKTIGSNGATTFLTQGDNNDLADPLPVQEIQIVGTIWYAVPWLGYVNTVINGEARQLVVPLAAGGLFLYSSYMVASGLRDRRRAKKAAAASTAASITTASERPAEQVPRA